MDSFVSFFAEAGYTVARDFLFTLTINNLLNKKNYLWYGYQETPFEITGGISYRW
jgi:outer membrane receptor protein involved in Fe transport